MMLDQNWLTYKKIKHLMRCIKSLAISYAEKKRNHLNRSYLTFIAHFDMHERTFPKSCFLFFWCFYTCGLSCVII